MWYDQQRFLDGRTYGIPVLFPFPNRIRDGRYLFDGVSYGPMGMHGFVKDEAFAVTPVHEEEGKACIEGVFDFTEIHPLFKCFPFSFNLTVGITLSPHKIRWEYRVRNTGGRSFGYGFALHPFFLCTDDTTMQVDAPYVMDSDANNLPTGRLVPVEGTRYDLLSMHTVREVAGLDSVLYREEGSFGCRMTSPGVARIAMETSGEFRHFVVYTPVGAPYFCLEPQTSSTDCHNLYALGHRKVSNLLIVNPQSNLSGWIEMEIQPDT
ncbi:MAG: hypothetical protein WCR76_09990 [Sphaerochaetaceae bacterium]